MALRQVYDDNGTLKSKDIAGSGSANAADTAYDNSNTGLPASVQGAIDKTTGNISSLDTVELTATAAHAHAVGTSFMLIGQLVKTTSAIAVGDTIAVGTNVEPTSVLDLLGDVNTALANKQDKLTNPLTKADVVNNLTSDVANVPLSAAMGKSLNDVLATKISIYVSKNQSVSTDEAANFECFNSVNNVIVFGIRVHGNYICSIGYNDSVGYYGHIMNFDMTPVANSNFTVDVIYTPYDWL